jgi:hypothetical protein
MKGLRSLVAAYLVLAPVRLRAQHPGADSVALVPPLEVRVDSSRREMVLTAGPFHLPVEAPETAQMSGQMNMDMAGMEAIVLQRFSWPMECWVRGLRVELVDRDGHVLPRRFLHHLIMVNFARRQLIYPAAERVMGVASETDGGEITVPKTIGIPMHVGQGLGVYVMWHNQTGRDIDGVFWRMTVKWSPTNLQPRPISVLPIYMDTNMSEDGNNEFSVPPGRTTKSFEFTLPVGGHLLGVGGHLHDYGSSVRLEDAETGNVLVTLRARRDSAGKLLGLERKLFATRGEGLRIHANHRYRVVGQYDNPTRDTLPGAMAHMVGIFAPDDMTKWPKIDPTNRWYQKDLADLLGSGKSL